MFAVYSARHFGASLRNIKSYKTLNKTNYYHVSLWSARMFLGSGTLLQHFPLDN